MTDFELFKQNHVRVPRPEPEPPKSYRLLVTVESTQGNGMNTFVLKFGSKDARLSASRAISSSYARHYELVLTYLPEE